MRSADTWVTRGNQRLDVAWMDSVHLVHCVNLLLTRTPLRNVLVSGVFKEAKLRGMVPKDYDGTPLVVPAWRETADEMCMLNAIVETQPKLLQRWKRNEAKFLAECAVWNPELWAEFVKLKLTR